VILVAYEVSPSGGMARAAFELIAGLLDREIPVTVVSRTCELPPHPRLRWIRVRVPARPASLSTPLFFFLGSFAVMRAGGGVRLSEGPAVCSRVDAIRVHFCHRGYSGRPTSRQRTRDSLHYRINALAASVLGRLWEWWCFRPTRVGRLVPVSTGLARELSTHFPALADRMEVIPNSVDTDSFKPEPEARDRIRSGLGIGEDTMLALFVGGTWEQKGLGFAIDAVGAADGWQLLVVGEGDPGSYRDLVIRAGAGNRVHFIGKVADPAPYYAAADAFVFPSRYEALSLVTLEAAAAGLPLLVTRVSGAEDVVREGANGWFIERDASTIVPHLRALGEDPDLRRRLGENARSSVQPFSTHRVADECARLLEQLAASSPQQA
jgi:glycosyltransferase involved in cell wall biosynthesis